MEFVYATGGREKYFKKANVRDCVCRAICNATGMNYLDVYNLINSYAKREHVTKNKKVKSSACNGVAKNTIYRIITDLGWTWIPTKFVGSSKVIHLKADELPKGNLIVAVSRHLTNVKDGVIYDTYDCSRNETRCVYGYYIKK